MAKQSLVQSLRGLSFSQRIEKGWYDLLVALRESIAPMVGALVGSLTTDIASIATGSQVSTNITVTGAVVGDYVQVQPSVAIGNLAISAMVTAANTVTMTLVNNSGGAIDPPNCTYQVVVTPRAAYAKASNFGL